MRTRRSNWTAMLGLAVAMTSTGLAHAEDSGRLTAFRQGDKTSYAVSLAPEMAAKEVDGVDVVVLFDTSASQQGAYRETALEALKTFAAGLRPSDRMQIVAVDLSARDVTTEFVAGDDAAVAKAVATLNEQAPLGSSDIEAGLDAALQKLETGKSANRAVVYIGDGVSMANLLDAPTMGPLVEKLRAARVPVSSYAVGPQVDAQLLAVLANQSGGNLYVAEPMVWQDEKAGVSDARAREENVRNAQAAAKHLASWSRAAVAWPTKAQLPSELGQSYPTAFPPLRADRDTVIVGQTPAEISKPLAVAVSAVGSDGKAVDFKWSVAPSQPSNDNAFLSALVDAAKQDGGLTLPTLGTAGLTEVARLMGAQSDELTMLAQKAVATGDREGALQIVEAVLRQDPGNVQARTVQTAIESGAPVQAAPATAAPAAEAPAAAAPAAAPAVGGEIILNKAVAADPIPPAEPGLLERRGPDGTFLDEVEQERRAYSQMLQTEVSNTVIEARERMSAEPQVAIQELKLALENVRRAAELDAPTRASLEDKLSIALKEATRKASIKDELDRLRDEELAAVREQKYLDAQLSRNIEREKQLMDRFNALMDERRYVEAEEVAAIVNEVDPDGVTPRVASLWSRMQRHVYLQQVTRAARHAAAWDTMFQIELSHIPFPDNPPIVYPDAPIWEELTKRRKDRYSVDLKSEGEAERRIYNALRQPLRAPVSEVEAPLNQVLQILKDDYDIPIIFDTAALDAVAASPETEVTIDIANVTLKSALELILKAAGEDLTYIVDNEVLLITTQEEAEKRLQVRVYPVADLVMPIENIGGGMMGGMGGGGMGGGGMGGGGMGGGGMGGMGGGGMGGGGMGGGGMGGGGGMFAVPDAVNAKPAPIKPATAVEAQVPVVQQPATQEPMAEPKVGGIEIDLSVAPEAFWSKYFAEKQQDQSVVRHAAKQLIKTGHYNHAIALIQAALANGQPQPWMYESLGIALELNGSPKSEIERAVMSACDFSTSPEELMLIARYLSHIGLNDRAVDVYRQVAKVDPSKSDAYSLGLRAAQRANNVDGIRWAAVGILKQAWPAEQQELRNQAMRIAQATLEELQSAGKQEEADRFRSDLDEALVRDCVVKVSWSGDADVDLIVEEPGGSICSLRAPRSSGGGAMLGDDYANFEKQEKSGSFSETYVCPQGFTGDYKVRVRKVWGDVVADRVTVDVYKNYRTKNEQHQRQHIAVNGDDDAMVVFNLEQGRRNDPISGQQLVASVERQQAISQAVMAQQLGSISDPSILPGRPRSSEDFFDLRRQLAFARGGAVGYQPVIITLPEGSQLVAQAVVSADRRYVRISAAPSFTGIGNVTTFAFAGASTEVDEDEDGADTADTADAADAGDGGGGFDDGGVLDFFDF